jgi:integrase
VLTEEELREFWTRLNDARMDEGTRLALKLQLATAQRSGEVISSAWDEFDLVNGWWTIPAEKSKNKLPHRVPLSPPALEVLEQARKVCGGSFYPFPSPRGDKPMAQIALGHALRKNLAVLGVGDFTPHDLRRTAASHMTGMGISRLVVSKILNHVERGVTAVYDRHSYDAEKRQALEAWGRKLQAIITGQAPSNVVTLSTARSK